MKERSSRLGNSLRNLTASWLNQAAVIGLGFVGRMVFVRFLSQEYLGLSGLFGDILSMLSLAELGVGTAITFQLYKPLATGEEDKVRRLMNFYRRIYTAIGVFILLAGLALSPFLSFFIKDMPDIPHLKLIFMLMVANSASTYFFSYKTSLLNADQKSYLPQLSLLGGSVATCVGQIAVLALTRNYLLYLTVQIVCSLGANAFISRVADRHYPFLRTDRKVLPTGEEVRGVVKYAGAAMLHKIGALVVFSTDNIIISKFQGLLSVASYSNYQLLSKGLASILQQVFRSMTASVGNLGALEEGEHQYAVFRRLLIFNHWCYSFAACGLFCVATPLVELCFGEVYAMEQSVVALLTVSFYLTGMRRTAQTFNDGCGLLYHNRYAPIIEGLINLGASVALVYVMGVEGVILGTILSTLLVPFWVEPVVTFRFQFRRSPAPYFARQGGFFLLTAGECALSWGLCALFQGPVWLQVVVRVVICTGVPNLVNLLVFWFTKDFAYYRALAARLLHRGK